MQSRHAALCCEMNEELDVSMKNGLSSLNT